MKLAVTLTTLAMSSNVNAISVGTFGILDNWATGASRLAGAGGDYAGVDAVSALIGDDLSDGAINLGFIDSFQLDFAGGIMNNAGADFVIFDGRFSSDNIYVEINGNEQLIGAGSFLDSGLDLVLSNSTLGFDLFGASLDLTDWGIASGSSIFSLNIRGAGQSDIMGVSGVSAIPVPAAVWLFGSGLIGLAGLARRKEA